MKLILIRHTTPIEDETKTVRTDDLRFVTSDGRKLARKVFGVLNERLTGIEKIFTSPLIRAVQTSEILAAAIDFEGEIELVNELKNDSSTSSVISMLEQHSSLNEIALVGHEPKMGILLNTLCGDTPGIEGFAKCGIALLDYDPNSQEGKFIGYFNPGKIEDIK